MLPRSSRAILQTARNASFISPHARQLTSLRRILSSNLATAKLSAVPLLNQTRIPLLSVQHSLSIQQTWSRGASSNTKGPKEEAVLHSPDTEEAATSTTRSVFTELGDKPNENKSQFPMPHAKAPVSSALVGDLRVIKETFDLKSVPREAYVLGLAGLVPYVTTSFATVYCAWDIHYAQDHGTGFIISEETASYLLHYLEHLQVGYGAVILSFLGAIHWGLEWAKYGGTFGYRRYSIGVIAPAIAWPTVLFSYEYALISQFLGFTYLYYADAAATARGWAPPWYSTYRFVLTFLAGSAIVLSLVGKSEINDVLERRSAGSGSVTDPRDKIVTGVAEGDRRLSKFETEKAHMWDKKAEKRKAEEEAKQKEEDEDEKEQKNKQGKGKKKDQKDEESEGEEGEGKDSEGKDSEDKSGDKSK